MLLQFHFHNILEKFNFSRSQFLELIKELRKIECHGVMWEENVFRILYLGSQFAGSFEYFTFENESVNWYRKFYQLEDDVYWGFYESGLWCSAPFYIPN